MSTPNAPSTPTIPILDPNGQVVIPPKRKRAEINPGEKFLCDDTHFFGTLIRTAEHPLIPEASIVDEYVLDTDNEHLINTIKLFSLAYNLLLIGETGCGKTQLLKFLCAKLRIPLYQVQGHAHLEWDDLVGRWILMDGNSVFVPGPLALALEEGACFLLDECASVKQGILNGLNELANGGALVTSNGEGHKVYSRTPGFRLTMTANPWDSYGGNNELNLAFLNRFKVRYFKYLTQKAEIDRLTGKFPSISRNVVTALVKFANKTRSAKDNDPESVRYILDTRSLQSVCEMIEDVGVTPMQAIEDCVLSIVKLSAPDEYKNVLDWATNCLGTKTV